MVAGPYVACKGVLYISGLKYLYHCTFEMMTALIIKSDNLFFTVYCLFHLETKITEEIPPSSQYIEHFIFYFNSSLILSP
jgi:hypothetical protein